MAQTSLSGSAAMQAKIKRLREKFPNEVDAAFYVEVQIDTTEVKRRTPVDKGTLRGTVHAIGPNRSGGKSYMLIVAGGPAAPYAIYVHENLTAVHKVGQAKFIESVIMESVKTLGKRIAKRIDLNRAAGA